MTTIADLSQESDDDLRWYVRQHIPPTEHMWLTHDQLVMKVARIMSDMGQLDPNDSNILNIPGFDQIYIVEGGDMGKALSHFSFDVGTNSIRPLLDLTESN